MHKFPRGDGDHADHTKMQRSIATRSTNECTESQTNKRKKHTHNTMWHWTWMTRGWEDKKVINMCTMMDYGALFQHSTISNAIGRPVGGQTHNSNTLVNKNKARLGPLQYFHTCTKWFLGQLASVIPTCTRGTSHPRNNTQDKGLDKGILCR